MRLDRVLGGVALLFLDVLVVAFLATANYDAVSNDPVRILTLLALAYFAVTLLVVGLRLMRSGGRRST